MKNQLLDIRTFNYLKVTLILLFSFSFLSLFSQTGGDAVIYPDNYIGKKIDKFFYDIKGWPNSVNTDAVASDLFITDDINGIRISIYGDTSHPAHPVSGTVIEAEYTQMLNSISRAKTIRADKDFYIFASKKLDEQTSFPDWTKDANGVIVEKYLELLTDYFKFMKTQGVEIDYLGIQNEEEYNEGNITPEKHKAIIDGLRVIALRENFKMPLIVGYEGFGPNKDNWMKTMATNGWMDRVDVYGTHYYPKFRPLSKLKNDLAFAGEIPFWSTEPHWDSKADVDDFDQAESAICALWDQVEVGMSAFMWWAYKRADTFRSNLMRHFSVPLKDAQMIDMNDIDGRDTNTYGKMQTRAFREDSTITIYVINNNTNQQYANYGFGLSTETIAGEATYTQWVRSGTVEGTSGTITPESPHKLRLTIPKESITVISFQLKKNSSAVKNSNDYTNSLILYPLPTTSELNIRGLANNTFYQINDLSGKTLLKSNLTKIDVSAIAMGMYILHTSDGRRAKFMKN